MGGGAQTGPQLPFPSLFAASAIAACTAEVRRFVGAVIDIPRHRGFVLLQLPPLFTAYPPAQQQPTQPQHRSSRCRWTRPKCACSCRRPAPTSTSAFCSLTLVLARRRRRRHSCVGAGGGPSARNVASPNHPHDAHTKHPPNKKKQGPARHVPDGRARGGRRVAVEGPRARPAPPGHQRRPAHRPLRARQDGVRRQGPRRRGVLSFVVLCCVVLCRRCSFGGGGGKHRPKHTHPPTPTHPHPPPNKQTPNAKNKKKVPLHLKIASGLTTGAIGITFASPTDLVKVRRARGGLIACPLRESGAVLTLRPPPLSSLNPLPRLSSIIKKPKGAHAERGQARAGRAEKVPQRVCGVRHHRAVSGRVFFLFWRWVVCVCGE